MSFNITPGFLVQNNIYLVLFTLRDSLLTFIHSDNLTSSLFIVVNKLDFFTVTKTMVSSSNNKINNIDETLDRSLTYIKNSSGPTMETWVTLHLMSMVLESCLLNDILLSFLKITLDPVIGNSSDAIFIQFHLNNIVIDCIKRHAKIKEDAQYIITFV